MGGVFFGVLRSGTTAEVREFLTGLDPTDTAVVATGEPAREKSLNVYGPAMLAAPQLIRELIADAWPETAWEHAALIAGCESGYIAAASNTAGEDSRGIFQINIGPGANTDLAALGDLYQPDVNIVAARIVWERQGWAAWLNCALSTGVGASGPGIP